MPPLSLEHTVAATQDAAAMRPRRIGWDARRKRFVVDHKACSGLLRQLRRCFYAGWDPAASPGPASLRASAVERAAGRGRRSGAALGTRVDRELAAVCRLAAALRKAAPGALSARLMQMLPAARARVAPALGAARNKAMRAQYLRWTDETRAAVKWMACNRLEPVYSQVPVGSARMRVCTAADLLCRDAQGRYWVVEVKTGYRRTHAARQGMLCWPYGAVGSSPQTHHQLQLLFTLLLARNSAASAGTAQLRFALANVRTGCVLRLLGKQWTTQMLEAWAWRPLASKQTASRVCNFVRTRTKHKKH